MALSDFFRINLPYGMKRNSKDEWFVFNREYMPLGWSSTDNQESIHLDSAFSKFPVYTKYENLTDKNIEKIIQDLGLIQIDSEGKIDKVFFYDDRTNPQSNPRYWSNYITIIKKLSDFKRIDF